MNTWLLSLIFYGVPLSQPVGKTMPPRLETCASCHGTTGNSTTPGVPNLAGQNYAYLVKQLEDFKSGRRNDPMMGAIAGTLSSDEMKSLAEYFSNQKCK